MDTRDLPVPPPAALDRTAVQVVAHRGSSAAEPEHTLAAYARAIEEGADALECDVRLTADGQLVCVHDRTVNRTSDGTGVVSKLTLAQLEKLDFGSWKAGSGPQPLLTMAQLLELAVDAGRRVELAIETKHPLRFGGRLEADLLTMLGHYGLLPKSPEDSRIRIMSFSERAVARVRAAAPAVPTVYLLERRLPLRGRVRTLPGGAPIAGPGIDLVRADPSLVPALRAAGHRVHVWTVDEPADVELCLELGVEAIITNRPREVLTQLGR